MAETLTIRTASSTEVVKIASVGPQGPKGDKGDPGDVAGLPLTTQGDTLYRGASQNERLPIGTSGQVLKVSAGGIPEWGAAPSGVSSWNDLTDKPSTFPPSTHTHTASDVTDFNAAAAAAAPVQSVNGSTGAVTVSVPTASSATPSALGVAAAGTSAEFSRADHVHAMPSAADVGAAPATGIDPTAITGTAVVDSDARLSDSRNPLSHSSSHAAGGSDPLAPSDISAMYALEVRNNITATSDITLAAGRNIQQRVQTYSATDIIVTLPISDLQAGDTVIVLTAAESTGDIIIRKQNHDGSGFGPQYATLATATLGGGGEKFTFRATSTGSNSWVLVVVDTHAHAATEITSGTLTHERGGLEADVSAYNGLVKISGGSTSAVGIGTGSTEVAAGDHGHGNLTTDGKIGSTAGLPLKTGTAGAIEAGAFGTGAGEFAEGNHTHTQLHDRSHAITSTSDHTAGNHKVFYSNGSGEIVELALGNSGEVLTSNGASAAPSFAAASGGFDPASPDPIGTTTPNTGAFTSLSTAPAANTEAFTTTGYSLTGSNAQSLVDLAGTWNTTGTPSAIKLNITDTASNASSLLMQLRTGGTDRFTVTKGGVASASTFSASFFSVGTGDFRSNGFPVLRSGTTEMLCFTTNSNVNIAANGLYSIGWASGGPTGTAIDLRMWRDAAATWALRDGTNAQEMRCYGTFSSSTNYQRMTIKSVKQTLSALSGASATTTGTFIPDGAVVVGVTTRVATALTGASGYEVGDGTDADRWGDITGTAIGTTSDNRDWTAGTIECFTAGGEITLTAKTSNFTAGAIEICVFYLAGQAD